MRARDGAEHQDQDPEPEHGGGRVLQQLQPDIVGGQLLGGDARADDDAHQQSGADELGQQPPCQEAHRVTASGGAMSSSADNCASAAGSTR